MTGLTRRGALLSAAAALAGCAVPAPAPAPAPITAPASEPFVPPEPLPQPIVRGPKLHSIYLVRHAEKQKDGTRDPGLTSEGGQRTRDLHDALIDYPLDVIWSTNYRRTRGTAATPARYRAVSVKMYDPRDLDGFAAQLRAKGENALVVGHSNTTPDLAQALGADPGTPIVEADEYDRLYIIDIGTNWTDSRIERFGVLSGYQ